MGMFDWVDCKYPLPDGFVLPVQNNFDLFQTKDLECFMNRYTITEDGELLLTKIDYENNHNNQPTKINYHGIITFYGSNIRGVSARGYITKNDEPLWKREYEAKFTDGKLVEIKLVPQEPSPLNHITREAFYANF